MISAMSVRPTHLDRHRLEALLGGLHARLGLVLLPRHVVDHGLQVLELARHLGDVDRW